MNTPNTPSTPNTPNIPNIPTASGNPITSGSAPGLNASATPPTAPKVTGAQSGLLAVIGKEFRRFFTDYRLMFTTVLLPGLMIYVIYSLMGGAMGDMMSVDEDYEPIMYAVNLPDSLAVSTEAYGMHFVAINQSEAAEIQALVADKQVDLLVIFPADFDQRMESQLAGQSNTDIPRIEVFYNSSRTESSVQMQVMMTMLDRYKTALAPLFVINAGQDASFAGVELPDESGGLPQAIPAYDLASSEDTSGFIFASILPMLIMTFLFSGCMAVAPESIAGEKERGTFATMLVTPLARWQLALGKIMALAAIALLSGVSSFLGVTLSLPKLIGEIPGELTTVSYAVSDYLFLLAIIACTVLLFVGMVSLLSAVAKTVKEAGTYVTPLMLLVLMTSVMAMFSQGAATNRLLYLIPAYNSVQSMIGVFSYAYDPICIAITVVSNIAYTALCVAILTRLFNSEKVVFSQ